MVAELCVPYPSGGSSQLPRATASCRAQAAADGDPQFSAWPVPARQEHNHDGDDGGALMTADASRGSSPPLPPPPPPPPPQLASPEQRQDASTRTAAEVQPPPLAMGVDAPCAESPSPRHASIQVRGTHPQPDAYYDPELDKRKSHSCPFPGYASNLKPGLALPLPLPPFLPSIMAMTQSLILFMASSSTKPRPADSALRRGSCSVGYVP